MTTRDAERRAIERDLDALPGKYIKRGTNPKTTVKLGGPYAYYPSGTTWDEIVFDPSKLTPDWNYTAIAVHHSGNVGITDPVHIAQNHLRQGYDDIGYHYLIHPNGTIYEGRSIACKGSHVSKANTGKIGILMMGDFDEQWWDFDDSLKKSHLQRLVEVIKVLKKHFPLIKTLGGHKEFLPGKGYTCPGNLIMDKIDELRRETSLNAP